MEEKKQETQPLGKGKADKSKMANVAGHVVGGAGIGAAAYAYGAHRTPEEETTDSGKDVIEKNIPEEEPVEEVIIQEENVETFEEEVVVEPEPIVHTDGIDFELQVNELPEEEENGETVQLEQPEEDVDVVLVDMPEPVLPDLDDAADVILIEEPVQPEGEIIIDSPIPEDELFADGSNGIDPDDVVINDIGSDIHQDLIG